MDSAKFYTKAKSYMKLAPDATYIIWSNPTEDIDRQTRARAMWLDYLEHESLHHTVKTFKAIWAGGGKAVTVPSEDPRTFDLRYHPAKDASRRAYGAQGQARDISEPSTYRTE